VSIVRKFLADINELCCSDHVQKQHDFKVLADRVESSDIAQPGRLLFSTLQGRQKHREFPSKLGPFGSRRRITLGLLLRAKDGTEYSSSFRCAVMQMEALMHHFGSHRPSPPVPAAIWWQQKRSRQLR
jgi:hypothetical protein